MWRGLARGETPSECARRLDQTESSASRSSVTRLFEGFPTLNDGMAAQLPDDLQVFWSELTGRQIPKVATSTADVSMAEDSFRELVIFAELVVKRLEPPLPAEIANRGYESELWLGSRLGAPLDNPVTDPVVLAVEADWPTLRCDIRTHPLFPELRERLGAADQAFAALDRVQAAYDTYRETSVQAWAYVRSNILERCRLFTNEECALLADVLLLDAYHHRTSGSEIQFKLIAGPSRTDERPESGDSRWVLQLGTTFVWRPAREEIEGVAARWPGLVADVSQGMIDREYQWNLQCH